MDKAKSVLQTVLRIKLGNILSLTGSYTESHTIENLSESNLVTRTYSWEEEIWERNDTIFWVDFLRTHYWTK